MIYEALSCLTEELNEFLRFNLNIVEDKVILTSLLNFDGSANPGVSDKVLLSLQNIEKLPLENSPVNINNIVGEHAININLYVLISANFNGNNYAESLKFISYIITFLQGKNIFTPINTPKLDRRIDKLTLEIENVDAAQQNNLASQFGIKYIPSLLVKISTLKYAGV